MIKYPFLKVTLYLIFLLPLGSCSKYLDLKPDKKLVVPSTMDDLQAILDYPFLNRAPFAILDMAGDDRELSKSTWQSLPEDWRDNYLWNTVGLNDLITWRSIYENVYKSNLIISLVAEIPDHTHNAEQEYMVRGSALFYRGQSFFDLAQVWTLPYDPVTAKSAPGIPLRLNPDFNEASTRPPLADVYQQILADLYLACELLPNQSDHKTRPSKAAAYGMLSRVYLTMGDYEKSYLYADSCLQLHQDWIDFNTLDTLSNVPFQNLNKEMIMLKTNSSLISRTRSGEVSSALLDLYEEDDLRRKMFFGMNDDGSYHFKGDYSGSTGVLFSGLTTGEMYLNRAEGHARRGDIAEALADLNELRKHRYEIGTFVPLVQTPGMDVIALVLAERRRELCFKGGLRWLDIRRLSREPAYAISLRREWPGETHALAPGDPRYAFRIPELVIELSGIPQNQY